MGPLKKPESDDEVNIEVEANEAVSKLPESVSINPPKASVTTGVSRRKKEGIDLHKALYKHEDENNRSGSEKVSKRSNEVSFTPESRDEKKFKRIKCMQTVAIFTYIVVVIALTFLFKENYILLALLFALNFIIVNYGGIFAIRAFVFPFSVWLIRDGVEG